MAKLELENAPAEVRTFLEGQRHLGSAEEYIRLRFKDDLAKAKIYEVRDDASGTSGAVITQRPKWDDRREEILRTVSSVIDNSIYDIVSFIVYYGGMVILLQLFDEEGGEPIEHKLALTTEMRRGSAVTISKDRRPLAVANELILDETEKKSIRPRWAEENRPKKAVKLRLQPDLIENVDAAAGDEGLTRNDWIELAIKNQLNRKPS